MSNLFSAATRSISLRPYQEEAVAAIERAFDEHQSCLMVMATGLGKTITAAELMRRRGGRAMWVAHRMELVEQAEQAIGNVTGVVPQVEMADRNAQQALGGPGVVVASVQTLNATRGGRQRMTRFIPDYYSTLVTDEAHHAVAKSWHRVASHFTGNEELRHLGMTATPDRGDEEALGQVYDHCAYRYDIQDGVQDGWLVPISVQVIEVDSIDLSSVGKVAGDFNQGELAAAMEEERPLHGVAEAVLKEARARRALIFTTSVKHAKLLADILNTKRPGSAASIDGKTPKDKRRYILNQYRAGDIQYLCNVGIATEGFDVPGIDCVAIARPTMSRSLYAQMIGRGTRPQAGIVDGLGEPFDRRAAIEASGKENLLVLDFVGNSGKHKLVSTADVLGGNYSLAVVEEATRMARSEGEPTDTIALLERAEAAVKMREKEERDRGMRRKIRSSASYRKRSLDPFDVLEIDPTPSNDEWNVKPLTHNQLMWLERSGFDTEMMSMQEQRKVLNTMINRKKRNLATPKQVALLKKFGYNTKGVSFADASRIIDGLARNGWRRSHT